MEELVKLIKERYEVDDDAAMSLASFGDEMIRKVLHDAAKSNESVENMMEVDGKMINERMVKKSLSSYAPSFRKTGPWYIQSAGDGNCSTTSIAGAMEIENTIRLIIKLLQEERMPTPEDGFPSLNFSRGSDVWDDGMRIRELYAKFYSTDEKLNQELPESMGKTTYTKKLDDGSLQNIERAMTRRDYLCLELQQLSRNDLNSLTKTKALLKSGNVEFDLSPDGRERCDALARAFVSDSSQPGVWCGWSMFYAVVCMRKPKTPLRIYHIEKNELKIHLDMVPDGLSLPSEENDDILHDNEKNHGYDGDADDETAFQEDEKKEEKDDEDDDEEEEEEEVPLFPRILYRPGHFDVLVSNHHKNLITNFWPETTRYFQSVF
jgi:hypothetical protein